MNSIKVKVLDFIKKILEKFQILEKFNIQKDKFEKGIFDKGLNFEKIQCNKNIYFYSFRIDINFRAYLRKEKGVFIIFDVNNHDYEKIKNKLKNM